LSTDHERRVAAVTAGHTGDVDGARAALADGNASVRAAAVGALHRLGALTAEEASACMADPDAGVRKRAVESSIALDIDLSAALDDPEASVVEAAAFALGERDHDPSPIDLLARVAAQHDDELCRESAVAAIGALGANPHADHDAVIDALIAALDDRATIRRRAIIGLHQFDDPRAEASVHAALEDKDRQVRALAADLLGVAAQ